MSLSKKMLMRIGIVAASLMMVAALGVAVWAAQDLDKSIGGTVKFDPKLGNTLKVEYQTVIDGTPSAEFAEITTLTDTYAFPAAIPLSSAGDTLVVKLTIGGSSLHAATNYAVTANVGTTSVLDTPTYTGSQTGDLTSSGTATVTVTFTLKSGIAAAGATSTFEVLVTFAEGSIA